VGLAISWGSKTGNTDGIFIPIIDVGAVTRLRLNAAADSASALPELAFKNIFSPGLYYTHGFKKSPFAINVGFQYGPQLQEVITSASGVQSTKLYDSIRFGVGFVFDIPLFNLSTKPRE
jgi:hypothetical protein